MPIQIKPTQQPKQSMVPICSGSFHMIHKCCFNTLTWNCKEVNIFMACVCWHITCHTESLSACQTNLSVWNCYGTNWYTCSKQSSSDQFNVKLELNLLVHVHTHVHADPQSDTYQLIQSAVSYVYIHWRCSTVTFRCAFLTWELRQREDCKDNQWHWSAISLVHRWF